MRRLQLILFAAGFLFAGSLPAAQAWPGVPYKTVRAYAWRPTVDRGVVVRRNMQPVRGAVARKGVALSMAQVERLIAAATRKRPKGRIIFSMCYQPHHAFIFYDERDRPVAFIEVCLSCHGSRTMPELVETEPQYADLADLCVELGLPFDASKSLKEYRADFLESYINADRR